MAQGKTITGYVYDAYGQPIVGATILLEGTSTGTTTDISGHYSLRLQPAPALTARLVCSSIGYKTQYVVIGNETSIEFFMEEYGAGADSDPDSGSDPTPTPKIFGNISNILLNGESATEVWLNGTQIWPEGATVLYFPFKINMNYYDQSTGTMHNYTADNVDLNDFETHNDIVLRAPNGSSSTEIHYTFGDAEQYFPSNSDLTFILEMFYPQSYFNNSAKIDLVIYPDDTDSGFVGINVNVGENVIYSQRSKMDVYNMADNDEVPHVDVYLNQCVVLVEDGDITCDKNSLSGTRTSWTITCIDYIKNGVTYTLPSAITLSSGSHTHQGNDHSFAWGAGNDSGFYYKVLPKGAWNSTLICNYRITNSTYGLLSSGTFNASITYDYTMGNGGYQEVYITPPPITAN